MTEEKKVTDEEIAESEAAYQQALIEEQEVANAELRAAKAADMG